MNRPRWECPECGPVWHVWELAHSHQPDVRALCMTPHPAGGTCGLECRRHRNTTTTTKDHA